VSVGARQGKEAESVQNPIKRKKSGAGSHLNAHTVRYSTQRVQRIPFQRVLRFAEIHLSALYFCDYFLFSVTWSDIKHRSDIATTKIIQFEKNTQREKAGK
jgi:hypothetical protein